MKSMMRTLCLLLAVLLPLSLACAEEPVVATVNGEVITFADYNAIESAYIYQYQLAGADMTDPVAYAYVQDLALTYVIEQRLVVQDMTAQGCFDFTEEEEAWCLEQGHLAWEQALADVGEMLRVEVGLEEGTDMTEAALAYAASLGVSEQTYVDEYRMQLATVKYHSWLVGGDGVSAAEVNAAYEQRVAASQALYAADVAAFETAIATGAEVWYMPMGYRAVLQILLPAEGTTNEERLANAQDTVAEIYALLEAGEPFVNLIVLYGTDANFADPAFIQTGYSVHPDSIMWDETFVAAAFAPEMAAPGCWSQPFASNLGVHILYYLGDVPGGAVEMTEEVYDALAYVLYAEKTQTALAARIDVLAETAEVIIH